MSDIKTDNSKTLVNALAEIERLRGRVAELEGELEGYRALKRLHRLETYPDEITARAWLLRQKAEAVEVMADFHDEDCGYLECLRDEELREFAGDCVREMPTNDIREYAQRLRQQADELENNNGQK